jgi:molecular chaperone HscB
MDHFARLGLPPSLELDSPSLDKAYFALQRQWHPDRFVSKPAEERARASSEAAALNDAYRTLKDPLSRALYLASLKGIELPGDGKTIDDPDLLTEVMDAREELQEASSVGGSMRWRNSPARIWRRGLRACRACSRRTTRRPSGRRSCACVISTNLPRKRAPGAPT